jgi:hypothetical protein
MNDMGHMRGFATELLFVFLSAFIAPLSATAAAPQVRTQGPGFYRVMLGDFEVTALLDGTHPFPVDTVMIDVSKDEVARDLARGPHEQGLGRALDHITRMSRCMARCRE